MELSSGSPNLQDYLKLTRGQRSSSNSPLLFNTTETETIDVSKINFDDDESWLCSSNTNEDCISDVEEWLHNGLNLNCLPRRTSSNIEIQKNIDTRTFTRPKKRFSRPSIEQYNDNMYGSSSETITILSDSKSYVIEERSETDNSKPNFDLTQPSSSYYFEKMVADSENVDSFLNMSPPSLVNSMCSSTFANLMESSFIKNDPVLREIRDADYSETVLLQDSEAPMFQSFTESCSSINSDTPENFLKKVAFSGTFRRNANKVEDKYKNIDITFDKQREEEKNDSTLKNSIEHNENNETYINPNGTYRFTPKQNCTFKKSDIKKSQTLIQMEPQEKLLSNRIRTLIQDCGSLESTKRDLSEPLEIHTDLNRLGYCLENNDINTMTNLKSSKLSGSAGSADSLDRLSSMSSSSRGSNKMLNMADVDAIVEMQERSLQQVMSTPIPSVNPKLIWENNFISPITGKEATSDSDLSSTDDYKSVRSTQSSKTSLDNYSSKEPPKSMNYITGPHLNIKIKTNQKSTYTVTCPKPLAARVQPQNTTTNSYSNLRRSNVAGSNSNLYKLGNSKAPSPPLTNLKNMGPKLKGSYTSLRPISSNLPEAPPLVSNSNRVITQNSGHHDVTRTLEGGKGIIDVQPMPKEKAAQLNDTFVKPQLPKASGLSRPTGIPRPSTSSRIPAPRSSNIRPISSRTAYSKRVLKKNVTQ